MSENSTNNTVSCYHCQQKLEIGTEGKISRKEECSACSASLHCCKMCKFYDTTAYNECRESNAERILDKEKANFCDYFVLKNSNSHADSAKNNLLSLANSLFKD